MVQLSYLYMTTGKTIVLTVQTFVCFDYSEEQGSLGCCCPWGWQRAGHNLMTEQQQSLLAKWSLCFLICCLGWSSLSSQGARIFWFHGCSHHLQWFWSPRKKNLPLFPFFPPIYLPWSDGTRCHDHSYWIHFFTLLFHPHQEALEFLFIFCH